MKLTRYLQFWWMSIRTSLIRQMEFRGAFIAETLLGFTWIGFVYLVAGIFFLHSQTIAGWTRADAFLLVASWSVIRDLVGALFRPGLTLITEYVQKGQFDVTLIRPLPALWQFLTARFLLSDFIQAIFDIGLLMWLLWQTHPDLSLVSGLVLVVLIGCGVIIDTAIVLALNSLSFWFVNIDNINVLYSSMSELSRFPAAAFKRAGWVLFTIVPLAYVGNVQALWLRDGQWSLVALAVGMAVVSVTGALWVFRRGSRRYTSASS